MNITKFVAPNTIFDSSVSFLRNISFESSTYLHGTAFINAPATVSAQNPYALVLETGTGNNLQIKSVQLGTMAFQASTNYYTAAQLDASFNVIWTKFSSEDASIVALRTKDSNIDTSLNQIWSKLGSEDSSIVALRTKDSNIDTSLNQIWSKLGNEDTSINGAYTAINDLSLNRLKDVRNINVTGNASIYAYETDNVAYIKKLVAGSGATITEDASTITIAVSGVAGYVRKYSGTFDGTANASIGILAVTHGLGTGPLSITVYESNQQVWPAIDCDDSGNVVISWSPGSLGTNCKYIIVG